MKTWISILGGTLLVFPLFGFAYSEKTTHPALTQEIVKLFNREFKDLKISDEDAEHIIQGSIDEDSGARWMQHFYDPVYNRGLVLGKQWMSSKEWAQDTKAQGGNASALAGLYFGSPEDYSWDRAIYDYVWGNEKRGLKSLGHVLHLLEDASVPDHTRNDPHPPYLNMGSPYEGWTKKFDRATIDIASNKRPVLLTNLNDYFDELAQYSNNNFFSKDTLFDKSYALPRVKYFSGGFGFHENGYPLLQKINRFDGVEYTLKDRGEIITTSYWSLLSKQAVLHGAGVIKLFFDEVEKEKQTKTLYEKSRPWAGKIMDKTIDKIKELFSSPAGIVLAIPEEIQKEMSVVEIGESKNLTVSSNSLGNSTETLEVSIPTGRETPRSSLISEVGPLPRVPTEVRPQLPQPPYPPPAPKNTSAAVPIAGAAGPPPDTVEVSPPSGGETSEPPDTTAPDVSLTITECSQSFSNDGCLVATTTLNISWSSMASDLDHFEITVNGVTSTTTTTSTSTIVSDSATTTISIRAKDLTGNWSSAQSQTISVATRPVIINEVAWAGTSASTSADEWIELHNPTSQSVSLSDWVLRSATDNSPYINLSSTTIAAGGFYLLERTDQNTISDITANQIYTGALVNDGEQLELSKASTTIDKTPEISACSGWCGGSSDAYYSMERYDPLSSGTESSNWGSFQSFLANGKNADNVAINGTPTRRNSLNYLITKSGSTLSQNKTLKKSSSPYIISGGYTVASGATLTLEPGVIIKFLTGQPSLTINGVLQAEGTSAEKIVFTAFKDDDYAGDTNQDATSTTPVAGDWGSIKIAADGSIFDYAVVRYGGLEDGSGNHWANIRVETASSTIKNSIIEKSKTYGIWYKNASGGTADSNTIRDNNRDVSGETPGTGIQVTNSSPTITNSQFTGNTKGLVIESGSAPSVSGNTFSQNTTSPIEVNTSHPTFSSNSASSNGTNGIFVQGAISQNYTLSSNLPFVIQATYSVPATTTLTIAAGTIVKLSGSGNISASGKINAAGTSGSKIVFTSLHDDDCGISGGCGDTNATTTSPAAGDWDNIIFNSGAASSTLQYVVIRYGGDDGNPLLNPPRGALRLISTSIDIQNSTFEKNYIAGIFMQNSTSTAISDSIMRDHTDATSETFYGLYLTSTSTPTINNTAFSSNETNIFTDSTSSYTNGGGNTGL